MMSGFGMGFSWIWMAIFWLLFIGGGVLLLVALFPQGRRNLAAGSDGDSDALTILKRRYARGEVSKEEFETIRHDLEQ